MALGAGGIAGGAFHAGVLAALHEVTGWDPRDAEVVVGTSAGSIAGTSLRAGLSPADMLARQEGRRLSAEGARLLSKVGPPRAIRLESTVGRPRAAADIARTVARAAARPFSARPVALIAGLLPEGTLGTEMIVEGVGGLLADWPRRPLWICAVRQSDGRRVAFGRDGKPLLASAVAASCAIPGFFKPVDIEGERYVDGGVHSPTNADLLVRERLDLVIIFSPMSIAGRPLRLAIDQPVRQWARLLVDREALRLRRGGTPVVAFQPTAEDAAVMGSNAMDPSRRATVARQAYESTLRRLERADTRKQLAPLL